MAEKTAAEFGSVEPVVSESENASDTPSEFAAAPEAKRPWWKIFLVWGSAPQIIVAALLALAIGLPVSLTVDKVPKEAPVYLNIPGDLWLRSLKAIVIPLITSAMILAVYKLRVISRGGRSLAKWTIGYYLGTTIMAIIVSSIMTARVWSPLFIEAPEADRVYQDDSTYAESADTTPPLEGVIQQMFQSFIPDNVAYALANNQLLSVLVVSIVVGYLIEDEDSSILRAAREVERMVTIVVRFIIKCSAFGVFSLILSNILKLDPATMGKNLAILIASALTNMALHVFIVVPIIFFALTRMNPYTYWIKNSPALITAWGSASSAAALPISLACARDRGISKTVRSFSVPLGCLVNMDGTAIYFPIVIVFLARTQGMTLSAVDYIIIVAAATLSSIGSTPIPSSSLALSIMIAGLVGVPVTGMMGVVFAIDWLLDRFRTALNVSGDLYGAMVVYKKTGIEDLDEGDLVVEGRPVTEAPPYVQSMA